MLCCITKEVKHMTIPKNSAPYIQAASVLPDSFRSAVERVSGPVQQSAEEFRLRRGAPMSLVWEGKEHTLDTPPVTEQDLRQVLELASHFSAHTVLDRVRAGFVTIKGGHRIGLCGEVVTRNGEIHALDKLFSIAIRIAKPIEGVGEKALCAMQEDGKLCSALILAPPGAGKTTLLRELIRRISDGIGVETQRVGLVDERGEVAALWDGKPQFGVGAHTDIMSGCPKAVGMAVLLRGMAPQVLAVDEVTAEPDVEAMAWAAGCGVTLLCTAHGGGLVDLRRRPIYRRLMDLGIFRRVLLLENVSGIRRVTAEAPT